MMPALGPYQPNHVYCGECAEMMEALPGSCIDLTITSPPYDNLRSYKGYTFDFASIATQLYRVTKQGGIVVWVVGDQTIKGSETGNSFRHALGFMELGFNLHDTMIYQTNKPPVRQRRYHPEFEYMFILSKGKPSAFNPIRVQSLFPGVKNTGGHRTKQGRKQVYERKQSRTAPTKIKGNIWYLPRSSKSGDAQSRSHPATFPEALARDHILSWSNPGDLILDPMVGSGTVPKMCVLTNRNYLGFDISQEYVDLARRRVTQAQPPLF